MSSKRRRFLALRQITLLPAPTVPFPTSAFFAQNPGTIAGAGRTLSFTATPTPFPLPTAAPDVEAAGDEADALTSSLFATLEATSTSSASLEPAVAGLEPSAPPPPPRNGPPPATASDIPATEPGPSGLSSLGIAGISISLTAVAIIAFLTFVLFRRSRQRAATLRQQERMVMGGATPVEKEKPRAVSTASTEGEVVMVGLGSARVADLEVGFIRDGRVSGETVYRQGQARETAEFDFGFQEGRRGYEVSVVSQRQSEDGLGMGGTWGDVERRIEEERREEEERRRNTGP